MAEVVELIKELSEKFDTLQEDVDSLKECSGKQKKKKSKRSHRWRHTRSHTRSQSRSKLRRSSHSPWGRKSRRDSPSRSRSVSSSPRRGTRGQPDDQRSSPSGVETGSRCGEKARSGSNAVPTDRERTSQPPRVWHEVPVDDTPNYNEVITWRDSDDEAEDCPTTTNLERRSL